MLTCNMYMLYFTEWKPKEFGRQWEGWEDRQELNGLLNSGSNGLRWKSGQKGKQGNKFKTNNMPMLSNREAYRNKIEKQGETR